MKKDPGVGGASRLPRRYAASLRDRQALSAANTGHRATTAALTPPSTLNHQRQQLSRNYLLF